MLPPLHNLSLSVSLLLIVLTVTVSAQVSQQGTDDYLKSLLTDYYTGKLVRARIAIPARRKGLEIIDGQLRPASIGSADSAAQPGEPLLIAQFSFKSKSIEVEFKGGTEEQPEITGITAAKKLAINQKKIIIPRLSLQFSRDLTTRDLNIQTINRLLAVAVDVSNLTLEPVERPVAATDSEPPRRRPTVADLTLKLTERRAAAEGISTPPLRDNSVVAEAGIAEVTIECASGTARLYLNGTFSGQTPRTIRLAAGIHTILLVREGAEFQEKKFFIPAGKASLIRIE